MLNNPETKILVVLDGTYANQRSEADNELVQQNAVKVLTEAGLDVETEVMCCLTESGNDCDPESIMHDIDELSKRLCIDDYGCVIAEGAAGWFWLQCQYPIPVICINPIMEPTNAFDDIIGTYEFNVFKNIHNLREMNIQESICIISAENEDDTLCDFFLDNAIDYSDEFSTSLEFWQEVAAKVSEIL